MKSVAEMLVLAWHGLSDLDSILRLSACAKGSAAARSSSALESEGAMAGVVERIAARRLGA